MQLWFHNQPGVGIKLRRLLKEYYGTVENIFLAKDTSQIKIFLQNNSRQPQKAIEAFSNMMRQRNLEKEKRLYEELRNREIYITMQGQALYPPLLQEIYDPPDILYVKGDIKNADKIYERCIGIVGSRKATSYGREICRKFTRELCKQNITIVSGLARGIDSIAHRECICSGGRTIAVLGCGINVTYPPENVELFQEIAKNGLILSEYGLNVRPNAAYFPIRNRIISGLSDGILVVEARAQSGSLITADQALEQGRTVFAVPGRLTDENSMGTNQLISQGAVLANTPETLLFELYQLGESSSTTIEEEIEVKQKLLAPNIKRVYSVLGLDPVYIDDIIEQSGMGVSEVIKCLYYLETEHFIRQPVQGFYTIML